MISNTDIYNVKTLCFSVAPKPKNATNKQKSVKPHLSSTPTATAIDPTPANSPTIHRRLVQEDRNVCLGEPAYLPKNPQPYKNPKNGISLPRKI